MSNAPTSVVQGTTTAFARFERHEGEVGTRELGDQRHDVGSHAVQPGAVTLVVLGGHAAGGVDDEEHVGV